MKTAVATLQAEQDELVRRDPDESMVIRGGSLSMGLKSATDEKATLENTVEGLELTNKVFSSTLEKFGVETVNPVGEKFNPDLHEAVTMVPMPDKTSNTVLEVIQTGFTLNGRLVRPALVIVVQ